MRDRFISHQVRILLERMDLYPEEFVHPCESRRINSKWGEVLDEGTFNRLERFLIKRKVRALKRKVTQDLILATIIYEPTEDRVEAANQVANHASLMEALRKRKKSKNDNNNRF
jgi:hypothetical protein